MKKIIISIFICTSLVLLLGCTEKHNMYETKKPESKVVQPEQDIKETQSQEETEEMSESKTATVFLTEESADSADDAYNIDIIAQDVSAAVEAAKTAVPSGTQSEQRDQYFAIKNVLEDLEHTLDQYENFLEEEYRSDRLTREEYDASEKTCEELENQLDEAEDFLEETFAL